MFKKAFKVSANNTLSGKDKKKLMSDLGKYYDADSLNALLEKNNPMIVTNKLQGSKIQLYIIDNVPIIVDATSKGDYFPTVYAIQQCPNLTKPVEINTGVDTFIMSGANLMWPGVKNIKDLGSFQKDDVRYVKAADNRVIAVGAMACSSEELATKGATGTAMFVLHIIEDKLWASGPKKVLGPLVVETPKQEEKIVEKAGEKTDEKAKEESKANETKAQEKSESEEEEDEEEEEEDHGADDLAQYFGGMIKKKPGVSQPKPSNKAAVPVKKQAAKKQDIDDDDDDDDKKKKKGGKKGKGGKKNEEETKKDKKDSKKGKKKGSDEEDEDEEEEEDEEEDDEKEESKEAGGQNIPTKIMDEYLMEAFLTALKISVDEKDLPMDAGDFHSNHLLPCKREGIFIDLKNTSYKKIGKFLQAMAKLGIIDFKESKKGAVPQITRIHRQNSKLADFEPVVSKAAKKENKEEELSEDDRWPKITITELYKIKPQLLQFFPEGDSKDQIYTHEEVQNTLQKYINANNLIDKRFIKLDDRLRPLFWVEKPESDDEKDKPEVEGEPKKPKVKKQPSYTMTREDLFKKLDDYLYPSYKITDLQTKEEELKQGTFKGVSMVAEKSHNKNVTRITGLEPFKFNINSLVNKFQLKYACSVSTHNFKEKGADKTEVTVHGNFIDQLADYFADECKIDRKYISTNNKLDKKKKEKVYGI